MFEQLMLALMLWIGAQTGLPVPDEIPLVMHVTTERLCELSYLDEEDNKFLAQCLSGDDYVVGGAYDFLGHTMYLPSSWSATRPRDVSILVHELTHFMQDRANRSYACRGGRERVAYDAQIEYLREGSLDFFEIFEVDQLFFMVTMTCDNLMPL